VRGIPGPIPSLAGVPWTYPCVWCGDYYPAEAVLARLPLCLHCAQKERQTLSEAARQQRQRNITDVFPCNWYGIETDNLTFACMECGRRYKPSGEKIPLGIEHWCLACVIQRERKSGAAYSNRETPAPVTQPLPGRPPIFKSRDALLKALLAAGRELHKRGRKVSRTGVADTFRQYAMTDEGRQGLPEAADLKHCEPARISEWCTMYNTDFELDVRAVVELE